MEDKTEREGVYYQLYGGGGEDQLGPGVFTQGEGLVQGPGEGFKVGGVGRGWSGFVSYCEENGPGDVYRRGEATREKAMRFAENAGCNVREGCCN